MCVSIIDDGGRYYVQGFGLIVSCFKKVMVVFLLLSL